jgi:hypothetical protein
VYNHGHGMVPVRLRLTLAAVLAIALLAGSTGAWAHPVVEVVTAVEAEPPPAAAPPALIAPVETPATTMPGALVLSLALVVAGVAAAPRRALALALVLVLGVLALELGIHSVHHLGDRQAASQCDVASASTHVHGATPQAPTCGPWVPTILGAVLAPESGQPGARITRPDEGRAPPAA